MDGMITLTEVILMKTLFKHTVCIVLALTILLCSAPSVFAADDNAAGQKSCTIEKGDTLWKIAVRFRTGLSVLISANPQLTDANMIYPGQVMP